LALARFSLDYVEAHGFSRGNQGIKSEAALAAVPMYPQRLKAFCY
jgi:hypothetical protein